MKELHQEKEHLFALFKQVERKQKVVQTELFELKDLVMLEKTKSRIAVTVPNSCESSIFQLSKQTNLFNRLFNI